MHGLCPALIFAGGQRRPAMPVVRARLVPRQAPPATPTRLPRARVVLTVISVVGKCHQVLSRVEIQNTRVHYFSSAMKIHRTEKNGSWLASFF
jgi:hypothetical protein